MVVAAFWSRNFALCFESGGFCRGGGGGFPDLVKKGRMAIWASKIFFFGGVAYSRGEQIRFGSVFT